MYCFACEIPHRCRLRQWSTCEVSTNSDQQRCNTTTIHQKNFYPFLIFSIGQNIQKVRELKSKLKEEILGCFPKIEVPKKHKNHFCSLPCGHLIHPGIFLSGSYCQRKQTFCVIWWRTDTLLQLTFLFSYLCTIKKSSIYQSRSGRGFAVNAIQSVLISWKITGV